MTIKCILCNRSSLIFFKKVKSKKLYKCPECNLIYTEKKKLNIKVQKKRNLYNLANYLSNWKIQEIKIKNIILILQSKLKYGKILEVGSGFGLFAHILASNLNYKIEVLEPKLPLYFLKKNKDILIHRLTYQRYLKKCVKKYDCIIFIDVIEHFDNPYKILIKTKKIMKKNGLVAIQVPNYKSLMAWLCNNWSWWMVEDHKVHFSSESIARLLKRAGFTILHFHTYEPFYDLKKNLDGNFTSITNQIIRKISKLIYFSIFFPLYFALRKVIWQLGYGGLIFVIARKD